MRSNINRLLNKYESLYSRVYSNLYENRNEDELERLFKKYVPKKSPAATVAEEIISAANRIMHRYRNYGDSIDYCFPGSTEPYPSFYWLVHMIHNRMYRKK